LLQSIIELLGQSDDRQTNKRMDKRNNIAIAVCNGNVVSFVHSFVCQSVAWQAQQVNNAGGSEHC